MVNGKLVCVRERKREREWGREKNKNNIPKKVRALVEENSSKCEWERKREQEWAAAATNLKYYKKDTLGFLRVGPVCTVA